MKIRIQSLNITFRDLINTVYHQTGIDYRERYQESIYKSLNELRNLLREFFKELSNMTIVVEKILDYCPINSSAWTNKEKESFDRSLEILRVLRRENVYFSYTLNSEDKRVLSSSSPPLFEWLMENIVSQKRKVLIEKT